MVRAIVLNAKDQKFNPLCGQNFVFSIFYFIVAMKAAATKVDPDAFINVFILI